MRGLLFAIALATPNQAPLPTDAVKDEATAITIAKTTCGSFYQAAPDLPWTATFRDGVWDVSVQLGGHLGRADSPHGGTVKIRASDGTPEGCDEYITVY